MHYQCFFYAVLQRIDFGDAMLKVKEYTFVFMFGAVLYSFIEVAFRGFTHWTMTVTGGGLFLLIYLINIRLENRSLLLKCVAGSALITAVEFAVGCIVNLWLRMDVWDYSDRPLNILGQICPLFTIIWFFLCIPAVALSRYIRKSFSREPLI